MLRMLKNLSGILTFLTGARRRGRQVDPHDEKGGKPLAREQVKISRKHSKIKSGGKPLPTEHSERGGKVRN